MDAKAGTWCNPFMTFPDGSSIYEFLKTVGAFSGLGIGLRWVAIKFLNRLTRREKELLVAARGWGEPLTLFTCGGSPWLQVGREDIGNDAVPNSLYIDALQSLVTRGFIWNVEQNFFSLTGKGEQKADSLKRSISPDSIPCVARSAGQKALD
jgi:hypothetical protein